MSISQIMIAGSGGSKTYNFPPPGYGSWSSGWGSSPGSQGTPYNPGGGVSGVSGNNWSWLLVRRAYIGFWNNQNSSTNDNPGVFDGSVKETVSDQYVAFSENSGIDGYCFEWKGYFQTSTPGNWNFACTADDTCMVWFGTDALNPTSGNILCNSHNNGGLNYNSVTVGAGLYYPIRIRFQEWYGGEACNVFAAIADSEPITLSQYGYTHMYYRTNTDGY